MTLMRLRAGYYLIQPGHGVQVRQSDVSRWSYAAEGPWWVPWFPNRLAAFHCFFRYLKNLHYHDNHLPNPHSPRWKHLTLNFLMKLYCFNLTPTFPSRQVRCPLSYRVSISSRSSRSPNPSYGGEDTGCSCNSTHTLTMMFLEDQHRPQPHRPLPTPPNVDPQPFRPPQKVLPPWTVPCQECSLPFPSQILDLVRILLGQAIQSLVQVLPHLSRIFHQVQPLNLLDDGPEQDRPGRIAHPRVELTIRLVRPQLGIAEVEARRLRLLGEGHHVRRFGQLPVVVGPELPRRAHARLHLVNDEQDPVLLGDGAQAAEEGG